ncbi:MAG: ribonuclease III [Candidatus Goldbacteria bacterium]|nr:ribonuclease III [Candidatus Goldiibacteriota bacterium]
MSRYIENYLKKNLIFDSDEVQQALTHSSYDVKNYEQMEFLGDAVLGLVIGEFLYEKMKDVKVGEIAKMKSYLVSRDVLFRIGTKCGVINLIKTGQALQKREIKNNKKIICDVMEAIIGAVYIKTGLEKVKKFILDIYKDELKNSKTRKNFNDYKSNLQIKSLDICGVLPEYLVLKTEGQEHRRTFYVQVTVNKNFEGRGKGKTIKEAEQMAAKDCLKKIK